MTNSVKFTNSAINSGTAISVAVQSVTYNWNNLIGDFPIPGKNDIIANQHQGWKNPGIHLQFLIYLDRPIIGDVQTNFIDIVDPAYDNFMTLILWNQLVMNTTTNTTINIKIGDSDTDFKSYAHSASGVANIPVSIVSWTTNITPDTNVLLIDCQMIETI